MRRVTRKKRSAAVAAGTVVLAVAVLAAMLPAVATAGGPIAYPDLQVLMPTGDIAIMHKSGQRLLEFTHITEDSGAGPLEIRPTYDAATGISQGYQALYTMPSPGVWTYAESVPIVGPMIWTPPSDYNFPLDRFRLYTATAEGAVGSLVATSPKDLFCMTSDTYVGGAANTPEENGYPGGACTEPEGRLGLSVGWGDQYEFTDGGEGIDITGLANGTYWLRGEADPYHYFRESDTANNVTETKLRIEGETVKVIEQIVPDSTPPSVSLTAPAAETAVSGTETLSAEATGPAPIESVQFLLDGKPLGAPVTAPPYTMSWHVGSTAPGQHYLSAQATDDRGFNGTAPDTPVNVAPRVGAVTIAKTISQSGESTITTPPFSTSGPGQVLLAFVDADGPSGGGQTATVTGSSLAWHLVQRADAQPGDAEVWTAAAPSAVGGETVTATAADGGYHESLTVVALSGATGIGNAASAGATKGAPTVSFTPSGTGSVAFATGNDWDRASARTLGEGQEMLAQDLDTGAGNTFWTQYATAVSTAPGQAMSVSDSAPTNDHWNMAAVEVLAAAEGPDTEPPSVALTNPVAGQTVSGTTALSAEASDNVGVASVQFYLDGSPLGAPVTHPPYALSWNTREAGDGAHTLTALATDTSGNHAESAPVEVQVENPYQPSPCFVVDVSTGVEGTKRAETQPFTTAEPGEQLVAFVSADGPPGAERQAAKVSGAVKWRLVRRANSQTGDAEIWTGTATRALKHKRVKSVLKVKGYNQTLRVISVEMSDGVGASASAGAPSGAPAVSLATSEPESLVYAVGEDPGGAVARSLGPEQVLLSQQVSTTASNTFWTQLLGKTTGVAGEVVTLDDTAPETDPWNLAAVEIRGDGPDK